MHTTFKLLSIIKILKNAGMLPQKVKNAYALEVLIMQVIDTTPKWPKNYYLQFYWP